MPSLAPKKARGALKGAQMSSLQIMRKDFGAVAFRGVRADREDQADVLLNTGGVSECRWRMRSKKRNRLLSGC